MAGASGSEAEENRIQDVVDYLSTRYELVLVPLAMLFMFWTRRLSVDNFRRDDGIYLAAIDSYYHWRTTMYSVENWPRTMPWDIWTAWSRGRYVGQFGTAFDQLIATVALIVGLGNPSDAVVHEVVLFMIPFMAALVAIPVYLIGARLGGRLAGIAAVFLLALFPGSFFSRSVAGQHQHHVAEVLFMAIALFAFIVALSIAERDKPVWELVKVRDLDALRPTIGYSALAGVALAMYMWMWPPGTLFIGILGTFFIVYLSIEYIAGRSPEHIAFVGAISMVVSGILVLAVIEEMSTSPTSFGYIAPVLAFCVAGGCVFMAWFARYWERTELDRLLYPIGIGASVVIAFAILWLVLPDVVERMFSDVQRRIMPLGSAPTDLTIQEANPPGNYGEQAFREFGLAFYTALIGIAGMILAPFFGKRAKAEHALIVIWALFIISMSTAQLRFWYYLALAVAIPNAYVIGYVIRWADVSGGIEQLRNIEGYQIMVLATVVMILVVPLMPPVAAATVVDIGGNQGPHGDTVKWQDSLEYLQGSTPEVGDWAGAGNNFDHYATVERPADGDYPYPDGSYGVISWWDYGHLITTEGERIPHSNPFQTNADTSAAFLLAESEERASLMLDAIPTRASVDEMSTDEIRSVVDERTEQHEREQTRYVMIDDGMATGKFGAITEWAGPDRDAFVGIEELEVGDAGTADLQRMNDRFYDTTIGSFYYDDANGAEQYRLVHESERQSFIASVAFAGDGGLETIMVNMNAQGIINAFQNMGIPFTSLEQIMIDPQFELYDQRVESEVKTFERVEGATITGTAGPNDDVVTSVVVNTTHRTFEYRQTATADENGEFALTVPYATSEDLGPDDGYTATEVVTEGDYQIYAFNEAGNITSMGSAQIPEQAIYDGEDITVELTDSEE